MAYSYVWPLTLPQRPLSSGYSEKPGSNILRTPMDAGPAKMRRRGTRPDTITCTYLLTAAQIATLETFCETTIQGTARFGWPHPRTTSAVEARLVPDGEGSLYSLAPVSRDSWLMTANFEVLP